MKETGYQNAWLFHALRFLCVIVGDLIDEILFNIYDFRCHDFVVPAA